MTDPSILFCTPCYGGMVTSAHFCSCLNLKEELTRVGLAHDWLIGTNESLVTRARNEMTASFLTTKHSHMFWLDADIEFTPADVAAIWNLEADIGVGVYAMKVRDKQWFAAWKDGELVKDLDQFNGPIEVQYAGTGFMCIRREVIEKLAASAPSYEGGRSLLDHKGGVSPGNRVAAIYMTPIHNDGFESEDYHFSRIAREAGFKIVMDPSVRLGHWGQFRYGA
jgi:hypothetical protein